jgi:DNA (cytosine-5)-methyltransferase 1
LARVAIDLLGLKCYALAMDAAVVDLFCGIGGLSYGFKAEGFKVIAGVDVDPTCQYAFEKNVRAQFIADDITEMSGAKLKKFFAGADVDRTILVGCAPCTPFSLYASRYKRSARNDSRWLLLREFSRLAVAVKPDIISMENVPRLAKQRVFLDFVKELKRVGYYVTYRVVRADHYGVPQRRSRLVLLASRHGEIEFPKPTHFDAPKTVRDAIGSLPPIKAGGVHPSDRFHSCRGLTPRNLSRIRATKEGGSWKDWSDSLKLACHKRSRGKTFRSVYGRLSWDAPSSVITTQCLGIGNGRFGHPEQDRAISIREAALLQSFPRSYDFWPKDKAVPQLHLARHIGNAVPVGLARVIARAIKRHIKSIDS